MQQLQEDVRLTVQNIAESLLINGAMSVAVNVATVACPEVAIPVRAAVTGYNLYQHGESATQSLSSLYNAIQEGNMIQVGRDGVSFSGQLLGFALASSNLRQKIVPGS